MKKAKQKVKNVTSKATQKVKGTIQKYNDWETKKKFVPSIAKTGVDLVAATAGGGVGAMLGYWSVAAGALVTLGGHLLGDKTGFIKTFGLSAMVYGFAKGYENSQAASQNSINGISLGSVKDGVKTRMVDFKDNLIHALYLGKLIKDKSPSKRLDSEEMGSVNLDEFDVYDEFAQQQIEQQALDEERQLEIIEDDPIEMQIDDEPDQEDGEEYTEFEELDSEVVDFNTM